MRGTCLSLHPWPGKHKMFLFSASLLNEEMRKVSPLFNFMSVIAGEATLESTFVGYLTSSDGNCYSMECFFFYGCVHARLCTRPRAYTHTIVFIPSIFPVCHWPFSYVYEFLMNSRISYTLKYFSFCSAIAFRIIFFPRLQTAMSLLIFPQLFILSVYWCVCAFGARPSGRCVGIWCQLQVDGPPLTGCWLLPCVFGSHRSLCSGPAL